jgi:Uma2 family endonuclease
MVWTRQALGVIGPGEDLTMATVSAEKTIPYVGPEMAGILMTPEEFDAIEDCDRDYRYELINGVLVVSPYPLEAERDPNEELGYLLRTYKEQHPQGSALDATLGEQYIRTENRRRADRVIWAGLARLPNPRADLPTIVLEFVSEGRRSHQRDYVVKRDEYLGAGVREYWIIDRFRRTLTVFDAELGPAKPRVVPESESYRTPRLPGFELPLARLLGLADRWGASQD